MHCEANLKIPLEWFSQCLELFLLGLVGRAGRDSLYLVSGTRR